MTRVTRRNRLLTPRAAELGRRIRQEEWYVLLSQAPHQGARRFAAALLVGAISDELRAEEALDVAIQLLEPPG